MLLRVLCLLILSLTLPGRSASGQAVEPGSGVQEVGEVSAEWTRKDLLFPPASTPEPLTPGQERYALPAGLSAAVDAERRRPRWLFPATGAAVGGAVFTYLTYRACQGEDCIFPVGPPLIGIGLGAILGWGVEVIVD